MGKTRRIQLAEARAKYYAKRVGKFFEEKEDEMEYEWR